MRVFKNSSLKTIYIISAILGLITYVFFIVCQKESGLSLLEYMIYLPVAIIAFPFEVAGTIFNWRKLFKGFIAPIPIISYIIQSFVCFYLGIKGFIKLLKHEDLEIIDNKDANGNE